ncbi:Phospholipase A1 [Sphingomonas guangdongensis]|uniref:Phospholipase A1 n=1 Tax=Sphingomonas guangdongensis TaxID=1141890 RepID=A0A285QAK8_9SPHN|nr:phospholipase A [Sphingomonas guangdongensis]SOB78960.1 Phospholipase A1 [Sphingomonas guangdongensis]
MRLLLLPALLVATPAAAQLRVAPEPPVSASAARGGVSVFLVNEGAAPVTGVAPERLEVVAQDGSRLAIVPAERAPASVPANGFVRVRYLSAGVISVGPPPAVAASPAAAAPSAVAPPPAAPLNAPPPAPMRTTDLPPSAAEPAPLPPPPASPPPSAAALSRDPAPPLPAETSVASGNGSSSAFVDRFSAYEPIYGAIGVGDAGTKLQVSFALRPFGGTGALSHFRFAYTQTMFWATDLPSGPFRATTYSPEAFFDVPVADTARLAFGYRHDSNGEGERTSIDANRLFVRAVKTWDLGSGWQAELVPQAWVYVAQRGLGRDVEDYWGFTSLKASLLQNNGVKLSVAARGNPGTGRGAAELFASYPLQRLGGFGVYLFGQAFAGYGEALDDYRRRESHARIGISLTR